MPLLGVVDPLALAHLIVRTACGAVVVLFLMVIVVVVVAAAAVVMLVFHVVCSLVIRRRPQVNALDCLRLESRVSMRGVRRQRALQTGAGEPECFQQMLVLRGGRRRRRHGRGRGQTYPKAAI